MIAFLKRLLPRAQQRVCGVVGHVWGSPRVFVSERGATVVVEDCCRCGKRRTEWKEKVERWPT